MVRTDQLAKEIGKISHPVFKGQVNPANLSQIEHTLEKLDVKNKIVTNGLKIQQDRLKELTLQAISATSNQI